MAEELRIRQGVLQRGSSVEGSDAEIAVLTMDGRPCWPRRVTGEELVNDVRDGSRRLYSDDSVTTSVLDAVENIVEIGAQVLSRCPILQQSPADEAERAVS